MNPEVSILERLRLAYEPHMPELLRRGAAELGVEVLESRVEGRDAAVIRERFPATSGLPALRFVEGQGRGRRRPIRAAVVLSGGQAPGGHNVIAGLYDGLREAHGASRLHGFLGGPKGIFTGRHVELDAERIAPFRNTGGFDLIGSGRDKIETPEQLEACARICGQLELDGLVVVGGDDSNTNAAVLAEHFLDRGLATAVVGVPKTIDGDLRGGGVEISFGFDTAAKVYSELIGNICRDARSAGKYWHFVKLMGRSASHVTLECALATRANIALVAEEIAEQGLSLGQVADGVARAIRRRAEAGRSYGVCLVPEGLIEFVPEVRVLIGELNALLHAADAPRDPERLLAQLTPASGAVFDSMPVGIRRQMLLDRDAHGNVQVSKIDTEQLLESLVSQRIRLWSEQGEFPGKFQVQHHFLGYEGRSAPPSNFDADYTYTLGRIAALLTAFGRTGYICCVRNLAGPPEEWEAGAVPLVSLMHMEARKGRPVPVIAKALVDTSGEPFRTFAAGRGRWQLDDAYLYPGPVQYFGPIELTGAPPLTLTLAREAR